MSRGIKVLVRTGLFLLCTIALAVVTPMQAPTTLSVPRSNTAEIPPETNEHRDNEQLRERRDPARSSRRFRHSEVGPRVLLYWLWQPIERFRQRGQRAFRYRREAVDDSARSRHAPASLQVFRR